MVSGYCSCQTHDELERQKAGQSNGGFWSRQPRLCLTAMSRSASWFRNQSHCGRRFSPGYFVYIMSVSNDLFARAQQLIPGGVNSPVRAFRSVGGSPFFVKSAHGATLTTADNKELRIYTTTIPTEHRLYTLMHDYVYREGVAWQNSAYNQPTHTSFYLGDGMKPAPRPNITLVPRK